MRKARPSLDAMSALDTTVLVTDVTKTLTWDHFVELVKGDNCVVDAINNTRTGYLINDACVMAGRETKTPAGDGFQSRWWAESLWSPSGILWYTTIGGGGGVRIPIP